MKTIAWPVLAALALANCDRGERVNILTGEAMGTTYRIKAVGGVGEAEASIHKMLQGLDRDLSTWRDDSWVAAFNRAPAATVMKMPDSVTELMKLSGRYNERTEGRFDPTIGALIRVWGFGAWRGVWKGEPTAGEIEAARAACGFHHLHIDGKRISKLHSGLMLDFSAIAKGYAVDRMGDILRDAGCEHYIIEFGGDILAAGHASGKSGWTVAGPALEKPITLSDEAIASSGSEHQFRGGHSHVIDPRSGRPLAVGAPAAARAKTCAEADALATAELVASAYEKPGDPMDRVPGD
ncbi:MAG TPA: FAD:protein FMN transferase [Luteolibacter sp.]|nr:FAD:protein FMN transferase [Luteolibacter sp.]